MPKFFDRFLRERSADPYHGGRSYRCGCGRPVFFANSCCLGCGAALGYEPELGRVFAVGQIAGSDEWRTAGRVAGARRVYRRCANLNTPAACNWLISDLDKIEKYGGFCIACRLNRTIPDLSIPENGVLWGRIEHAKRRLVSILLALEMPVASKAEDPQHGLAFDFLRNPKEGPQVLTGHANGVITLNIAEGDPATRERIREDLNEPYRTLLGHLRHEVGHYYWDRLVSGTPWVDEFRRLFGDERADYPQSLKRNYAEGPPVDWHLRFISSYASSHPWEDWAETWSHILHMADTLATAMSYGLDPRRLDLEIEPFPPEALYQPDEPGAATFLTFLNSWIELSAVMNEMSRSMGVPDFYPFVLPRVAVTKMHFIYVVVRQEAEKLKPEPVPRAPLVEEASPLPG